MENYSPSRLSTLRFFYLLSIISTLMILICSITLISSDYLNFRSEVEGAVKEQNNRARTRFSETLIHTQYITESIANQILIHQSGRKSFDCDFVNSLLIGYRNSVNERISWSTFSWTDKDQNLTVSSNVGIMKTPIDMSKRDYMYLTKSYPRQAHLGKPVFGAVSNLWSIPVGYGLTNQRGQYLGAVITGIVIDGLSRHISESINDPNIAFAILDKNGEMLAKSEGFDLKKTHKFFKKLKASSGSESFQYGDGFYQKLDDYPYGLVTFYRYGVLHKESSIRLVLYVILTSSIT